MPKAKSDIVRTLAESWTAPAASAAGEVGRPLICIASTYTFHASFLESELLPRFLGLKFDETEGVRPFVVEREQALATARVGVLVDADHLDLCWNPSTLEQRTGRLDRIRCKAEVARMPIVIYEPYLGGSADEKMFRVVQDRERWFQIVMGQKFEFDEATSEALANRVPLPPDLANALVFDLRHFRPTTPAGSEETATPTPVGTTQMT